MLLVLASQVAFTLAARPRTAAIAPTNAEKANWERLMFRYAQPFMMWAGFTWAYLASDRWALAAFRDTAAVGMYAVVFQLGFYPVQMLSGLFAQLVAPVLFERIGDGRVPERVASARRLNDWLVIGGGGVTAVGVLAAAVLYRPLFTLFVAPQYRSVGSLLPWVVLASGLFAVAQTRSLWLMAEARTARLIVPKVATSVGGLLLNFVGAALGGVRGVVAASVAYSVLYFIWIVVITRPTAAQVDPAPEQAASRSWSRI
jgi:O-antigen/teichoic acid export membrane protein